MKQTTKDIIIKFTLEGIVTITLFISVLLDTLELFLLHLLPFPIETWRYVYVGICLPLAIAMPVLYILAIRWELRNNKKETKSA